MKFLLDTHVWIWWNMAPEKLSGKVREQNATIILPLNDFAPNREG